MAATSETGETLALPLPRYPVENSIRSIVPNSASEAVMQS